MKDNVLYKLTQDSDYIYGYPFDNQGQEAEIELRQKVAERIEKTNYLKEVCKHHSIPVMSREVRLFLEKMPQNAKILDIGGCLGWHWREINDFRPDVCIFIVDFIREHLLKAKKNLAPMINKNIYLIHGDATQLIFDDEQFDGVWTVQAFQHIPKFKKPVEEAYRVLKPRGYFINYSWGNAFWVRVVYAIFNKTYYVKGSVPERFWLARASQEQKNLIESIFNNRVTDRYSEIIFTPEFKILFPGKLNAFSGVIDSYLSNNLGVFSSIARQRSFQVQK